VTSLKINGTEIAGFIKVDGFEWQRNDVDGSGAGRAVTGKAIRDLIATKIRLDCTCRELTGAERTTLEGLLFAAPFLTVTCDDAIFRGLTRTMYCNAMSSGFSRRKQNGTEYWKDSKFVLVEQ
jgi:hypothetical protein